MEDFELSSLSFTENSMDAYLSSTSDTPTTKTASQKSGRVKVTSLGDLMGFDRVSSDTLVHKSKKELWKLVKDASGDYYVEQMFDPTGAPISE